jgi:hypothetical protein
LPSFLVQVKYIIHRSILEIKRNPVVVSSWIFINIILSLILGALYWKLPDGKNDPLDQVSKSNRISFFFFCGFIMYTYGAYPLSLTFPSVNTNNNI